MYELNLDHSLKSMIDTVMGSKCGWARSVKNSKLLLTAELTVQGHTSSVEELQWSPTEETVFASCSSDKTIKIWDTRTRNQAMLSVEAHQSDVNVMSWNADTTYMLASGGDDGALKAWDLRKFQSGDPVANFLHHK